MKLDKKMPKLFKLIWHTYGAYLRKANGLSFVSDINFDYDKENFLILSNHVGFYDPFYICAVMKRHIRWVAGAYLFKLGILKTILDKVALAISKQQGQSDLSTIRTMKQALKDGYAVGIFPEGTRSWDGEMMDVNYIALSKMIRMFKVPVVFIHMEGGFAQQPRWCNKKRKGNVTVHAKYLLTAEELETLSVEEIAKKTENYLKFSNDDWKEKALSYSYKSPVRAEGLQRLLYMCPSCHSIGTITTKGNRIFCSHCNGQGILTEKDNIESLDFSPKTMKEWHKWEEEEVGKLEGLKKEHGVLFQIGKNNVELEDISKDINVSLSNNNIVVETKVNGVYNIPLEDTTSLILNAKQTMELFCKGVLYRIRLEPDSSSLKYFEYYKAYCRRRDNV
ncbi:MAG: 1-acyl-sn-glycerol-3-phosphate acyltransferase [Sphaerochaetaceae bacterium]|nr:1-acyl-sn-glycerol-3-phosphate acyltransferase [Sphaerochaetaceae bacterium]